MQTACPCALIVSTHHSGAMSSLYLANHSCTTSVQVMVSDLWLSVLQALARVSIESNEHLRNHALVILHQ